MEEYGHQSIGCGVGSCNYNDHCKCTLHSIEVKPIPNGSTGKSCDESMCGSYKKK